MSTDPPPPLRDVTWLDVSVSLARHDAGEFVYGGDDHLYVGMDLTPGVPLRHASGDRRRSERTRRGGLHVLPPGAPSSWLHADPIEHLQVRIAPTALRRHPGGDRAWATPPRFNDADPLAAGLLTTLLQAASEPATVEPLYVDAVTTALLTRVLRPPAQPGTRPALTPRSFDMLIEYIESRLEGPIRLGELAVLTELSEGRLVGEFRRITGTSPHRFVVLRRLERAKALLAGTAAPISEVARRSGFYDQSHLTRAMRRHDNTTPHQYRRGTRAGGLASRATSSHGTSQRGESSKTTPRSGS